MIIELPYKNLKIFSIIDDIEIPLLTHYTDEKENHILRYVFNYNDNGFESIIWRTKEIHIYEYLNNRITLRELILEDDKEFLYVHSNTTLNSNDQVEVVSLTEISEDLLPDGNSYYGFSMPTKYEHLLNKYNSGFYIANLHERGVVLKIAPKTRKYGDTVSLDDVADFTSKVASSYNAFIEQDFYKNFKNKIHDSKEFERTKRKVRSKTTPRVCDAEFGSFEITISNDTINNDSLDSEVVAWSNKALKDYADNVLYVDYSNEATIKSIIETVSPIELKSIYEPFINTISQKEYQVNIRSIGSDKNIIFDKNYRKAKKEFRKIIADSVLFDEEPLKKKLIHLIIEVDANKEVGQLKKSELNKDLIISYEAKSFEFFLDEIVFNTVKYDLTKPLEFDIEINDNSEYLIKHPILHSDLLVDDKNLIKDEILRGISTNIFKSYSGDITAFFEKNDIHFK